MPQRNVNLTIQVKQTGLVCHKTADPIYNFPQIQMFFGSAMISIHSQNFKSDVEVEGKKNLDF